MTERHSGRDTDPVERHTYKDPTKGNQEDGLPETEMGRQSKLARCPWLILEAAGLDPISTRWMCSGKAEAATPVSWTISSTYTTSCRKPSQVTLFAQSRLSNVP